MNKRRAMVFENEESKEIKSKVHQETQSWDNPANPEDASDKRDLEQLKRQRKEAERRRESLSVESKKELGSSKSSESK